MASIGTLTASLQLQSAAFIRDMTKAQQSVATNTARMSKQMREVANASRGVEKQMATLKAGVLSAGAAIAGLGAAAALRGIITTSAEFEKLRASLNTVTGSATAAAAAFKQIQNFAARTPFDVQQATEAFIRMKSLGLDASREAMVSYANTASAMGKSLIQFAEAVADATTGEYERLKDFGIKASSEGEKVTFTFRGVATTIRKNAADIESYLRRIGDVEFAGAAEEQASKLGGALSNLGDSWARFTDRIGQGGVSSAVQDLARDFSAAADGATDLAQDLGSTLGAGIRATAEAAKLAARYMREISAAIAAVAAYKAATMFLGLAAAVGKLAKSMIVAKTAVEAFNIAVRKSPIGLLASAAAVGVAAIIEFSDSKDEATKAAERHAKALDTETGKISDQTKTLREAQKAALEQTVALSEARAQALREIQQMQNAGMPPVESGSYTATNGTEIAAFELQFRDLAAAIADEERAAARARQQLADFGTTAAATATTIKTTTEFTSEQATAFRRLEESLLPVVKAQREYDDSVKLLDQAIQAGQISFMQYNLMLETLAMNLDEATNKTSELEKAQRKAAEALTEANKTNDQLAAETQAIMDGAKAWESYKQAREITDNTDALRKDLEAAGVAAEEIERVVAQRRFLLETQGEALKKMQAEQALYQELESIGSRAFDRIGSSITQAFVEGKSSAISFKSVMLGVVSEIMQSFIQLAAINPLKNALFGTAAPTLAGGIFGSMFGAGFDTSMSSSLVQTGGSGVIGRTFVGPFADGGSFTVGSGFPSILAGRDNRLVPITARDGERVTVETPGQQRMKSGEASGNAGTTVNMTLNNPTRDMIPDIIQQLQAIGMRVNQVDRSVEGRSIRAVSDAQRRGNSTMRSAFG